MMRIVRHAVVEGDPLRVSVRGLGKVYRLYDSLWARLAALALAHRRSLGHAVPTLADVDLELRRGESVGVLGPNGAGKTTLLRILTGALFPTSGELEVRGRVIMLDLGGGLNAELSGRDNLITTGAAIGLSASEIDRRLDEMIEFSDLGDAIDAPVKTYSSGMAMRLAFSLYAHTDPDVLIIDEAFAVGDARFVLKCTEKLRHMLDSGVAVLLASHDTGAVAEICDRAIVLDRGRVCFEGDPIQAGDAYHTVLGIASGRQKVRSGGAEKVPPPIPSSSVEEFLAGAIIRDTAASRRADGDAEILGVRVMRNGRPSGGTFLFGDECRVEWLIHVRRPIPCLTSGVHVHTQLGTYVFGTSYVHLGEPVEIPRAGHYLFAIRFSMRLGPGKYVFSVGAAEPELERHSIGGNQLDRFRDAFKFEVLDFELEPSQPVPFLGLVDLCAEAEPPECLSVTGE